MAIKPSCADIDAWFAALDKFADSPFMEDGREQPDMPDADIEEDCRSAWN